MTQAEESLTCVICGSDYVRLQSDVVRCSHCGVLFSGQKAGYGNAIQGMATLARQNYRIVADALSRAMPLENAKILDVGAAEGGFTSMMLQRGAYCLAVEADQGAATEAIEKGLPLVLKSFEDFSTPAETYDAIVFNDVFEHMQNPVQVLQKCRQLLKPNGYLLINLPVSDGFLFKAVDFLARLGWSSPSRRIWAHGLSSPHIYFYNRKNLSMLLERNMFHFVEVGRLKALSMEGMYQRVRSTYGPVMALAISCVASALVLISAFLPADVIYMLYKKDE